MLFPMRLRILLLFAMVVAGCSSTPPAADVSLHEAAISSLGAVVNTARDEFAPAVTANGRRLVFTRGNVQTPYNRDLYEAASDGVRWMDTLRLPAPVTTAGNEGTPSFTADGQTLYYAAEGKGDALGSSDIYIASRQGRDWSAPVNPGFPLNTDAWDAHPSIAADGRVLYFASNRDGGQGGIDIWRSERDQSGLWKVPVNLGPAVNTPGDEVSPFIAADGRTLYFASDGLPGLGGTDMFMTQFLAGAWTTPVNLGRPLNSPENDEFFALDAEGKIVYFASRRSGGAGGLDLYRAEPNPYPPDPVVVLSGVVRDRRALVPLEAEIRVTTPQGTAVYHSNAFTGEYEVVLPAGVTCTVSASAPAHRPDTARFDLGDVVAFREIRRDFLLRGDGPQPRLSAAVTSDAPGADFSILGASAGPGLTMEEVVTRETLPLLTCVFFGKNSSEIPQRYNALTADAARGFTVSALPEGTIERYHHLLNIVALRMRERPASALTLTGCTDGGEAAGLGQQRADRVRVYLTGVWGIDPARISSVGRALPAAPSGTRTEEGREENRRVELSSTDPVLLDPVEITAVARQLRPAEVHFFPSIIADAGLSSWRFTVSVDGRALHTREGRTTYPDSLQWDWKDDAGSLPTPGKDLVYTLLARDVEGGEAAADSQRIPVRMITLEKKRAEDLPDRVREKISLILFDFDRALLSERNARLLDAAAGRMSAHSSVLVRGYTDALGDAAYNQGLSERRAASVRDALVPRAPSAALRSEGLGESQLLYDNSLPEGRFYCRTVQILVDTVK